MFKYNPLACLPSAEELPDSDDTPVDNELQNLIPNLHRRGASTHLETPQ